MLDEIISLVHDNLTGQEVILRRCMTGPRPLLIRDEGAR